MTEQTAAAQAPKEETRALAAPSQAKNVLAIFSSASMRAALQRVLPQHLTPERVVQVAAQAIQKSPILQRCTTLSLVASIMEASAIGLELEPTLGQAYLVPFYNRQTKAHIAVMIPGYKGYISLAMRSDLVSYVTPEIVYEKDHFQIKLGTQREIFHTPAEGDRGKPIGAYAVVRYKDGVTDFEWMTEEQIERVRERSQSGRRRKPGDEDKESGPWVTDTLEMWRKTPIRRLAKRLPLTPGTRPMLKLAGREEALDVGVLVPAEIPSGIKDELEAAGVEVAIEQAAEQQRERVQRRSEQKKGKDAPASETESAVPGLKRITPAEARSIFNVCEERNIPKEALAEILGRHGFEQATEITLKAFPAVWQDIVSWKKR